MTEIPDSLRSLFSASVRERDGKYVLEVPESEVENGALAVGRTYRVALLESLPTASDGEAAPSADDGRTRAGGQGPPDPPVTEGERREVTVETVGDQGDGIAKVDRGFVVIVPETRPGEQPTVEITEVQQNVAFATVVDHDPRVS